MSSNKTSPTIDKDNVGVVEDNNNNTNNNNANNNNTNNNNANNNNTNNNNTNNNNTNTNNTNTKKNKNKKNSNVNVDSSNEILQDLSDLENIESHDDFKTTKQFIIFKNQLDSFINNNLYILKECKENKRLLDLEYDDLNNKINYIQISVIVLSTVSGFLQSTKEFFSTPVSAVSVVGISISTYISLILSISKYYKLDEKKERIHNLREKYSNLHNKIEYRMDILGPWTNHKLWEHQDPDAKLNDWNTKVVTVMEEEYFTLIDTKQTLCTEFEIIMDSKSRNEYNIKNINLILSNRKKLFETKKQDWALEQMIEKNKIPLDFKSSIQLPGDDLNNWDDPI